MTQDVGSLGPQEWLSRIAQSAGSLGQDLLSFNSAYEATGDLEQIRSAHKAGYTNQNGALSSERRLKLLSKRHRAASGIARSSRQYFDHANDSELEDEIVDFLRRECSISSDGASSSRSVSPLSRWDNIRWSQTRDSSPKAEYDRSSKMHEAFHESQLLHNDGSQDPKEQVFDRSPDQAISPVDHQSFFAGYPTDSVRKEIAAALASREADHFDTHLETPPTADPEPATIEQQPAILDQRAARRVQLIASHLADVKLATKPYSMTLNSTISTARPAPSSTWSLAGAAQRTSSGLDSAYNQLCHGDMDTAWDGFQAQGPYCLASRYQPQRPDQRACGTLERMQQNAETLIASATEVTTSVQHSVTSRNQEDGDETEKEEEEAPLDFHCPWIGCHKHLENNYQYLRDADGKLEGFGCVHEGCDDVYVEEAEWRAHVLSAHHGLVQRVKDVAGGGHVVVKQDDGGDEDNADDVVVEKVFEGVWKGGVK